MNKPSEGDAIALQRYEHYKKRLQAILKKKNPKKVSAVDALLTKYKGREHGVYTKVCSKYGITPKPEWTPNGDPPPNVTAKAKREDIREKLKSVAPKKNSLGRNPRDPNCHKKPLRNPNEPREQIQRPRRCRIGKQHPDPKRMLQRRDQIQMHWKRRIRPRIPKPIRSIDGRSGPKINYRHSTTGKESKTMSTKYVILQNQ